MSPYALPDGKIAIAFSGGRTSAYMLYQIVEANGGLPSDRIEVTFQNTGREMSETLDFVQECGERWGVRIVWLEYRWQKPFFEVVSHNSASRDGEPFEALIRKKKGLPYKFARFCTSEMKVHCQTRYLRSIGWDRWLVATGIRADEQRRINGKIANKERWKPWYPLNDAGISKRDVADFWAAQPFDLRLPGVNGRTQLGNCDGCFLKSEASRAALAREYPERFAWWQRMEDMCATNGWGGRNQTFIDGQSYAALGSFVEAQGDWIFDDTNGALCQVEHGECTG